MLSSLYISIGRTHIKQVDGWMLILLECHTGQSLGPLSILVSIIQQNYTHTRARTHTHVHIYTTVHIIHLMEIVKFLQMESVSWNTLDYQTNTLATWLCCQLAVLLHLHTHAHTRTQSKAMQSLWQPCKTQLLLPSKPALRFQCTTQALQSCAGKPSWSRSSNPQENCPGFTERSQNQKFHNNPNIAKRDKDIWEFASPVNTRYPLLLQLDRLLPQLILDHQVPIIQLGRLEQCE